MLSNPGVSAGTNANYLDGLLGEIWWPPLCSQLQNLFGNISYRYFTNFRNHLTCSPANSVALHISIHEEDEEKCDPYTWGPFSLLNNACSSFQCIPAGMGLCRVWPQLHLPSSTSKPEKVFPCLGPRADLQMVEEGRNVKFQIKLMQWVRLIPELISWHLRHQTTN